MYLKIFFTAVTIEFYDNLNIPFYEHSKKFLSKFWSSDLIPFSHFFSYYFIELFY